MLKKGRGKNKGFRKRPAPEFDQKIIDLARVTRVMAGGKRLRFRACVVIGDKKGRVGVGMAKGADVSLAVNKAVKRAKKNLITVPLLNETIPHEVRVNHLSAKLLLKPAPKGTGIKAGGVVRVVLELAGVPNIVAKIMGTDNRVNNAKALLKGLDSFVEAAKKRAREKGKDGKKTSTVKNEKPAKKEKKQARTGEKKEEKKDKPVK